MTTFLENIFQVYVWENKEEEFQDLHHKNLTINQYTARFVQLSWFSPMMVATESQKAQKFLRGLKTDIFNRIMILKPSTYVEALEHAQTAKGLVVAQHQRISHFHVQ